MLDLAYGLTDTSRLGCQVNLTKELDGLEIKVPESVNDARSWYSSRRYDFRCFFLIYIDILMLQSDDWVIYDNISFLYEFAQNFYEFST